MSGATIRSESNSEVVYESRVRVEAESGGIKLIRLPEEADPVPMGMHGPVEDELPLNLYLVLKRTPQQQADSIISSLASSREPHRNITNG